MNFKKTIAKSLVVAMALGMVPVANLQTAKAAAAGEIKFSGITGVATSANANYWGIAKEDAKGGKGSVKIGDKSYKISNIQPYYDEIDAYSALKGKAGILAAGEKATPDGEWKVFAIPAAESAFKVQVIASTGAVKGTAPAHTLGGEFGYLYGTVGKPAKEVDWATSAAAIEVKLNEGKWQDFDTAFGGHTAATVTKKLKVFGQNGSTLTFRLKGTEKTWASKEAKVKVPAQPKAPSVKIDVAKDTTSIKAGMEYQVVKAGEALGANWTAATDKKGVSLATLNLGATENKDVHVRTAASAKKVASKITVVTVNKPAAALTVANFTGTGAAIKMSGKDVAVVESNLAYDITKGASLKNISTNDIEYAIVRATTPADKVKWSTLKASKDPEKKPTKANLKYSATPKDNTWGEATTKLFVRVAGTKQTKDNVATQSGVSAGAVMGLTNIAQAFKFVNAGSATDNTTDSTLTVTDNTTTAAIKIVTGAAAKFTIKANISKVVNPKGGAPKVKATNLPKGVTFKVGKVDAATGNFDIVINVGKATFKTEVPTVTADFTFKFEGVDSGFKVSFAKK